MPTIKQRGRAWQLNYSDASGQHRVSLGAVSAREARLSLQRKRLELLESPASLTAPTLLVFAERYLSWYESQYPSTYDRTSGIFERQLLPTFGSERLDAVPVVRVVDWIRSRQSDGAAPGTVLKEWRALRACLERAKDWGIIVRNPLAGHEAPPDRADAPPTFYTSEQLQQLYAHANSHEMTWRLMVNTGLRRGEALNLRIDDVRGDAIVVRSTNERPTKTRRWREVPLNASAQLVMQELRAASGGMYLLRQMNPRSLSREFTRAAARAGLHGTIHWLRHTFISHLVMAGVDLATVQRIAGHSTITTTMKYSHLTPGHAATSVQRIAL